MNGQHIQGTPMVVDYWRTKNLPPRLLFFLTHMHADHTSGLGASWQYPIHCTPVTAKLLKRKFNIAPELVVELELDTPSLLHITSPHSNARVSITVTAIDANHCPGSCMFLFEGYFGRILYTGDFRYSPVMADNPHLVGNKGLDALYLDNTYCDVSCTFPTREEATEMLLSLLRSHPNRTIYLGLHTLGKEELLVQVAMAMGWRVGVDHDRLELLKLLEMPDVFEVDMDECWIRTCPFYTLAKNYIREVKSEEALGILPTALYTGQGAISCPEHVKVIPYSDHSSFSELRTFVGLLGPRSVHPVVQGFTGEKAVIRATRTNMAIFSDLLDTQPPSDYSVPVAMVELLTGARLDTFSSMCYHRGSRWHRSPSPPRQGGGKPPNRTMPYGITRPRRKAQGIRYLSPLKAKRRKVSDNGDERDSDAERVSSAESSDCDAEKALHQRSLACDATSNPTFAAAKVTPSSVKVTPISCNGKPIVPSTIEIAPLTSLTLVKSLPSNPLPSKAMCYLPPRTSCSAAHHMPPPMSAETTPLPMPTSLGGNYTSLTAGSCVVATSVGTPPTCPRGTEATHPNVMEATPTNSSIQVVRNRYFAPGKEPVWCRQEPSVCARVVPIGHLKIRNPGWGQSTGKGDVSSGVHSIPRGFGEGVPNIGTTLLDSDREVLKLESPPLNITLAPLDLPNGMLFEPDKPQISPQVGVGCSKNPGSPEPPQLCWCGCNMVNSDDIPATAMRQVSPVMNDHTTLPSSRVTLPSSRVTLPSSLARVTLPNSGHVKPQVTGPVLSSSWSESSTRCQPQATSHLLLACPLALTSPNHTLSAHDVHPSRLVHTDVNHKAVGVEVGGPPCPKVNKEETQDDRDVFTSVTKQKQQSTKARRKLPRSILGAVRASESHMTCGMGGPSVHAVSDGLDNTCGMGRASTMSAPSSDVGNERCYPQIVSGLGCHGYSKEQLRRHAEECSCALCNAELAILCIQSHDIRNCFCDRCAWGISRYFAGGSAKS